MERFWTWIAWRLPRPLVKWCAIRLFAHATGNAHPDRTPSEITILDAIKAWDERIVNCRVRAVLEPTVEPGDRVLYRPGDQQFRVLDVSTEPFIQIEPVPEPGQEPLWSFWTPVSSLTLLPPE